MTAPDAADQLAKAEARRTWERDRASLLIEQPFLALLTMNLDIVPAVDCRLPTASTDGSRIYVNPYFLQTLTPDERVFVLAHEVWHCALQHFPRRGPREPRAWNVAIDHEVNAMLQSQGLKMPRDCIYFEPWHGKNAEWVYAKLERGYPPDRGRLADVHPEDPDTSYPNDGKLDPDYGPLVLGDVMRRWPARVVAVAQQIARQRGQLPGALQQLVDGIVRPVVPWQEVLRQFVTRTFGGERQWLPPNRRYVHQGVYLPSRRDVAIHLALAIDSSGSTGPYLAQFASELCALLGSFGRCQLDVIVCDAAIQAVYQWDEQALPRLATLDLPGGGGTDFMPVFEHLEKREPPRALLFLTDGVGPAPSQPPPYPVLWVLTADGEVPVPWGEVVRLPVPEVMPR